MSIQENTELEEVTQEIGFMPVFDSVGVQHMLIIKMLKINTDYPAQYEDADKLGDLGIEYGDED